MNQIPNLSPESNPPSIPSSSSGIFWWLLDCHGLIFNLALIVPSSIFVSYLASHARTSFAKLTHGGRSNIMIAYYALLWIVSLLNWLWCFLQAMQCDPAKQSSWNTFSLFTNSGMLFMEISIVAFLLQGNHSTGSDDLTRTFLASGIVVAVDLLLKAVYIYGFGIPFFIDDHETNGMKWGLWIVHRLLLCAIYGIILFMHHSKWRERLPARPAFYNYISAMLVLNCIALFALLLVENGAGLGFWLLDLMTVSYHALYLPFLYVTFLADFFQEDDMRLENVYYSEMKDAGFFDADWD